MIENTMESTEADERYLALQEKLKTLVVAMKEERAANALTIDEMQNDLDETKHQNEILQDKIVKLVDMVKVERKKVQDMEQDKGDEERGKKLDKERETERQADSQELKKTIEQVRSQQEEILELQNDLERVQSENAKLADQLDRQKVEKKTMQLEVEAIKEELATATNKLKQNSGDSNSALQKENEKLSQEVEKALAQVKESNVQAEEASSRADTLENKLATLVNVLKELKVERANWIQKEADLQSEIASLKENGINNSRSDTPASNVLRESAEYQEIQQKVQSMEKDIQKYISSSAELRQELVSANNKVKLAESSCDRLRDELEKIKSTPLSPQPESFMPLSPSGPPKLPPPPPPPPPAFKKPSGKLEIKKSNKPKNAAAAGDASDSLKAKLMEEISKGVKLRKVQPSAQPPKPPQQGKDDNNMFSLGAMASMLAKKRMARMSMRIDADDPMKGALDTLLAEVGHK